MRGFPSIPTIHRLFAPGMSSLVPHCFGLERFAEQEKDFLIRSLQIFISLHYAAGSHPSQSV
jgi:hypothetical protein